MKSTLILFFMLSVSAILAVRVLGASWKIVLIEFLVADGAGFTISRQFIHPQGGQ